MASENLLVILLPGNISLKQSDIPSHDLNEKPDITFFSTQIISAFMTLSFTFLRVPVIHVSSRIFVRRAYGFLSFKKATRCVFYLILNFYAFYTSYGFSKRKFRYLIILLFFHNLKSGSFNHSLLK